MQEAFAATISLISDARARASRPDDWERDTVALHAAAERYGEIQLIRALLAWPRRLLNALIDAFRRPAYA